MDGPEVIVQALVDRLAEALPVKLQALRVLREVAYNDVPDPYQVIGFEPESEALDELPAVYVVEQQSTMKSTASDATGTDFDVDTVLAVFAMVGGYSYESTARMRQLYTHAIREILLERPVLAGDIRVLNSNLAEAHSVTDRNADAELFAGVRFTVTVRSQERLNEYVPPKGTVPASGVDLQVHIERHADHPTTNP